MRPSAWHTLEAVFRSCFQRCLWARWGAGLGSRCWRGLCAGEGSRVPTVPAWLKRAQTVLKEGKKEGKSKETQVLLWARGGWRDGHLWRPQHAAATHPGMPDALALGAKANVPQIFLLPQSGNWAFLIQLGQGVQHLNPAPLAGSQGRLGHSPAAALPHSGGPQLQSQLLAAGQQVHGQPEKTRGPR